MFDQDAPSSALPGGFYMPVRSCRRRDRPEFRMPVVVAAALLKGVADGLQKPNLQHGLPGRHGHAAGCLGGHGADRSALRDHQRRLGHVAAAAAAVAGAEPRDQAQRRDGVHGRAALHHPADHQQSKAVPLLLVLDQEPGDGFPVFPLPAAALCGGDRGLLPESTHLQPAGAGGAGASAAQCRQALYRRECLPKGRAVTYHVAALYQLPAPDPDRTLPAGGAAPHPEAGGAV